MADSAGPGVPGVIAERLERLIAELHPPDRGPYSDREIARRVQAAAGPGDPTITHASISNIRNGTVRAPSIDKLAALAKHFGVPVSYFIDDDVAAATDKRLLELKESAAQARAADELAEVLEDQNVRAIAFRLAGLSTRTLRGIRTIVEGFRDTEGLPKIGDPKADGSK
ncbi:helix-turn-helix domain-containing protein (plasmid) [Streptomyces sp. BI20]|uniref:helix-turn-helix domain-containing protein n=1 Tax=Streptomyces sp. BI20 TaxID=3403460 RepID=UPI003C74F35C